MLKIAFLFLVTTNVYHESHWRDFWRGNEQRYSVYVHSKAQAQLGDFFSQYKLPFSMPTTLANTILAQVAMLQAALKDPDNQKFVYVSESTLPLQDFDYVYDVLMQEDRSFFDYNVNPHSDPSNCLYKRRSLDKIAPEFRYKNWQWVVLNRKHAQMMAQDKQILPIVATYEADNELYAATFLAAHGLLDEICKLDTCYVNWNRRNPPGAARPTPYIYTDFRDQESLNCMVQMIIKRFLFARKFSEFVDLAPLDPYLDYRRVLIYGI